MRIATLFATLCFVTIAATGQRPDIIVIVTDDQRHDQMGIAGHPFVQTPHTDALANRGVRFENAFVTTAICAASRASILTGMWEGTHGYTFGKPPLARELTDRAWPKLLKDAGYRTGFVGKWGVRAQPGVPHEMWDEFSPMSAPYLKKQARDGKRHITDIAAERAASFVLGADKDTPLCLLLCFNAPHAEDSNKQQYIPPPSLLTAYDHVTVPPPPLGDPEFFAALPRFMRKSMHRKRWHWRFDNDAKYQQMVKRYWAMITGADRAIGEVAEALHRTGRAQNTVIVFTSDNGYFLGERGFAGKWTIHEPSIRVPLIVADPRAPKQHGTTRQQMVLNTDLGPTVLDLANVAVPETYQGQSLVPILQGGSPEWRDEFFYEHLFDNAEIAKSEGVRGQRWVYARYFEQDPVYEELYDLQADPLQQHNLAELAEHKTALTQMRERCTVLRARYRN